MIKLNEALPKQTLSPAQIGALDKMSSELASLISAANTCEQLFKSSIIQSIFDKQEIRLFKENLNDVYMGGTSMRATVINARRDKSGDRK